MPLDDASKALLALIESWDMPPLNDDTLAEIRALTEANLPRLALPGEPVARVEELRVPVADGGSIGARGYWPSAETRLPAVLFVHGGGWVQGSPEHVDPLCRGIANQAGCVVVSVDYRLAPEHPFPVPLEDVYAALAWVVAHAGELGVDADRLAVAGESAGGNLAAALTLLAAERGGPAIAAQMLLCPALDASMSQPSIRELSTDYGLESEPLSWAWDRYRGGAALDDPLVSPLAATLSAPLPPTAIVVAECDPLRDEGIAYAAKLAAAGTDVRLRCWAAQVHCFFNCTAQLPLASVGVTEIARELRALLAGPSA